MGGRARSCVGLGLCAGALGVSHVLRQPVAVEDIGLAKGLDERLWSYTTQDGVLLRGKRYANPGGRPVILAHGFTANGLEFDIPREGRNLAAYLARRGLDVYLYNIRGCGRQPYLSEYRDWSFCLDHLAAFDMPAVIDGVARDTGKRPCWVGHSMGGSILYMYLQGASFRDGVFFADPELAERRNASLAAGLTLASPALFGWPEGAAYGRIMTSKQMRAVIRFLVRYLKKLPPERQRIGLFRHLSVLVHLAPRLSRAFARNPAMFLFYNPRNIEADVMVLMAERILDNVTVGMTLQFMQGVHEGPMMDLARRYDYTAGMGRITCPMSFITGDADFISCDAVRLSGYEAIGSEDKQFHRFEGFGHTDLVMGIDVDRKVYPVVAAWLEKAR
ncbi:MAG: alpha/beta fold hydrolase [Candidatus Geothermincolia bacterium]